MPIHDLGYRAWKGRTTADMLRWWVITQAGLRIAWKNLWLRRLLLVAWLPAAYMGGGLFMYEQWMANTEEYVSTSARFQKLREFRDEAGHDKSAGEISRELRQALMQDAAAMAEAEARNRAIRGARQRLEGFLPGLPLSLDRHDVWCWLMLVFFRYPQGLVMLLVVGLVAPPLVARDVGSRAFLLYFSRPINRAEYIFGKLAIVWALVLLITTAPALVLFLLGVLLSPDLSVLASTWDLPLRILAASAVVLIPTTTMALAMSSATTRSWLAGFAWFAVWVFGLVAYLVLWLTVAIPTQGEQLLGEKWTLISLYHTLGNVQAWVFHVETRVTPVLPSIALLAVLTVVSLVVLFRRVSSPMRI